MFDRYTVVVWLHSDIVKLIHSLFCRLQTNDKVYTVPIKIYVIQIVE